MVVSDTLKAEFPHRAVTLQYCARLGAVQGGCPLFYSEGRGPGDALISNLFCKLPFKKYYKSSL